MLVLDEGQNVYPGKCRFAFIRYGYVFLDHSMIDLVLRIVALHLMQVLMTSQMLPWSMSVKSTGTEADLAAITNQ